MYGTSACLGRFPHPTERVKEDHIATEWRALVVSRHPQTRVRFRRILRHRPLEVICCSSTREGCEILAREPISLAFCEDYLAHGGYLNLINAAKVANVRARIIAVLTMGDLFDSDPYLEAMRQGAWDVLRTSFRDTDVEWMVVHALHDDTKALASQS
jgi:DNA-binding NtrC family response regulator